MGEILGGLDGRASKRKRLCIPVQCSTIPMKLHPEGNDYQPVSQSVSHEP